MKILISLILLCHFVVSAQARLAETEGQLIARFGHPDFHHSDNIGDEFGFHEGDLRIKIILISGRSAVEEYTLPKGQKLTGDKLRHLFDINSNGDKWYKETTASSPGKTWKTRDGSVAIQMHQSNLRFMSKVWMALADKQTR